MRAKSEIISTLTSKLTSDIWKKLKNGLLGRELIAFGAEVISENENIKDTMLQQLNPETADKSGLYLLSQMNEVPITNIKPNAFVVQMASDSKTYAPFELIYSVGNNSFTNIEYTMRGKSVSLVNGTYKCYAHNMSNLSGALEDGEEVYMYDNGDSYACVKLGNAYPDSIIVTDEYGIEIPRYSTDTAMSNTIDVLCKVITGFDGNQYVRFICAENVEKPAKYRIVWLDHSAGEVDYDDEETSVKDNNITVAGIKYLSRGSVDNVEFMREQLKKELAKYQGLNTPKSVERYVNGFPYVIDSRCVADDKNGMVVYVKPSENKDLTMYLDFSEIAAHISLNSILFPRIKVMTGKRLNFGLQIDGVKDSIVKNNIKGLVQDIFAYDKMKFNSVVNTSQVLSEVYNNFGIVPSIRMTIDEDFTNNEPMSYVPVKNSIKGYDSNGALVAWENNEILFGKNLGAKVIPFLLYEVKCAIGKMFLLKKIATKRMYENFDYYHSDYYPTEVEYPFPNDYDVFYLYDASSNMVKPFDNSMFELICADSNPSVLHESWKKDGVNFGNLLDIEVLSTNCGMVINFIFNSSATQSTQEGNDVVYEYWNPNNMSAYSYYRDGKNKGREKDILKQGKYQTAFCVKQSNIMMSLSGGDWEVKGVHDGVADWLEGYYEGFKGINKSGVNLNLKANGFFFENDFYYPVSISDSEMIIRCRSIDKKIHIPLNGLLRGMIENKGVLYIIQERCITMVEGFSGLKQYCKIYNIYKDLTTPLYVDDIANGFNNSIIIKSKQNIYIADGFELLTDSKITFSNLRQIFTDIDTTECLIGSATSEYATCYKQVKDENQESYVFYCYDIKNNKTFSNSTATEFGVGTGETKTDVTMSVIAKKPYNVFKVGDVFSYQYNILDYSKTSEGKLQYELEKRVEIVKEEPYIDTSFGVSTIIPNYVSGNNLNNYKEEMKSVLKEYGLYEKEFENASALALYSELYVNIKRYLIKTEVTIERHQVTENIMITESKAIGFMDYKNNKIINESGVDIDHIKYECLSPFRLENAYLVLDNNAISFENE